LGRTAIVIADGAISITAISINVVPIIALFCACSDVITTDGLAVPGYLNGCTVASASGGGFVVEMKSVFAYFAFVVSKGAECALRV
jgi:hypothetical protein